jgi:hypothetical protein
MRRVEQRDTHIFLSLTTMPWMIARWLMAVLLMAASAHLMRAGLKHSGLSGAGPVIFSLISFVSAVILIAPETAFRIAEWFASFFSDLILPSERFPKPPLSYHLARHYRQCGRLEESLSHYESIVENYPDERDAYHELLAVAHQLGDRKTVARYSARYERRFGVPPPTSSAAIDA